MERAKPDIIGQIAKEAVERVLEKKDEMRKRQKSQKGVLERATRSIALHKIEKNAQVIIDLCAKNRMDMDAIHVNVMLQKIASLINNMKDEIDKISR